MPRYASVLLDTPLPQLDHTFEYRIPEHLEGLVFQGSKVSVPLRGGARFTDAYVTSVSDTQEFPGELQAIEKVISTLPILQQETLNLARAVADRQAGSAIDVLRLAIPPRYVRAEKAFTTQEQEKAAPSKVIVDQPDEFSFAINGDERIAVCVPPRLVSTNEKTVPNWVQLFISLASQQLRSGRSTVIAVPDFRDIQLLQGEFLSIGLEHHLVRVDAGINGQERYSNYLRSITDEPLIIIGNRSAVLAPTFNLGLIVLWDDGDHNYEEPLAPYAHARDIALIRQAQTNSALLFASHSRSLETQRLVDIGYLSEGEVRHVEQPQIIVTDEDSEEGTSSTRLPSRALLGAKKALEYGPVLVQVASPGFSPALACSTCREKAQCRNCSGPLGLKRQGDAPRCKWCGSINTSWVCRHCSGTLVRPIASGTERTSAEIGKAFPGVKIIVADGNHIVTEIADSPAVIVSTPGAEPRAQNGYSAILLLDGEILRGRQSYRVDEDVLRNWSNTISLARESAPVFLNGAGLHIGKVLQDANQVEWAQKELSDRLTLRLPPAVRVVSIEGSLEIVSQTCDSVPTELSTRILGPVTRADSSARALVFFDYRDGEALAKYLRSSIIASATMSKKATPQDRANARVLRLRVRFDDPDIDSM